MHWLEMANRECVSKHYLVMIQYTEERSYLCHHLIYIVNTTYDAVSRTEILQSRQNDGLSVFILKFNILMLTGRTVHSLVST
jgi:hypothetical protein